MFSVFLSSIILFCATNIDDLIVLGMLYAVSGSKKRILTGQLAGMAVLIAVSFFLSDFLQHVMEIRFLGVVPIVLGICFLFKKENADEKTPSVSCFSVAVLTVSNGADNIGAYTPFFAVQDGKQLFLSITTFFILTIVWCYAAAFAVNVEIFRLKTAKAKKIIIPAVFIGLGTVVLFLN